ncbi:MAG: hypothetical protein QM775_16725 [Pirellulales bacterium]
MQEVVKSAVYETLRQSASFGAGGWIVSLALLVFGVLYALHFWFVVVPDRRASRALTERLGVSNDRLSQSFAKLSDVTVDMRKAVDEIGTHAKATRRSLRRLRRDLKNQDDDRGGDFYERWKNT